MYYERTKQMLSMVCRKIFCGNGENKLQLMMLVVVVSSVTLLVENNTLVSQCDDGVVKSVVEECVGLGFCYDY